MAPISFPAFCPHCGLIFGSGIVVKRVGELRIEDVKSRCPRCGEWGEVPDGAFSFSGDTINVLSGSRLTRERVWRLEAILSAAREGRTSDAYAMNRIADEIPELAPFVRRYGPLMRRAFVVFLWAALQILIAQGISELRDDSATKADVKRAVEEALEYCKMEQP